MLITSQTFLIYILYMICFIFIKCMCICCFNSLVLQKPAYKYIGFYLKLFMSLYFVLFQNQGVKLDRCFRQTAFYSGEVIHRIYSFIHSEHSFIHSEHSFIHSEHSFIHSEHSFIHSEHSFVITK